MRALIRNPKDFWSGLIFIVSGLAAILLIQEHPMGSAGRMGPAYFPTVLGALLALIGGIAVLRSFFSDGEPVEAFKLRGGFLILLSTVLFGLLLRPAGLFIAIAVLVMISGMASSHFRWKPFLSVALLLAFFSVLVFVLGLKLPIPILGSWFGSLAS
ncbi:tripartite tricarboxylate transporter TctB family protein [Noviherbaspirillum galbum]|uniref:Tripartite tricarboxylate transporter TctB family protein n=1 Tax=Noviherbaspirillum galbum TaxID=2709383 RepID=A0A6B3SNL4_9BURK|nr:tripartite tricarboxylate transporter TctB family protein [Noviherbaspirillum galbum]NEX60855.1 tripartite tricarboxylate transporter TctB family protein [Noviherbaspirillum galbum]